MFFHEIVRNTNRITFITFELSTFDGTKIEPNSRNLEYVVHDMLLCTDDIIDYIKRFNMGLSGHFSWFDTNFTIKAAEGITRESYKHL